MIGRLGAGALLLGVFACKRDEDLPVMPAESASAAPTLPVDHLAPGELLEGSEKAFALWLPRGMHVDGTFVDVVYASGTVPSDALANYVRAHVRDGKVVTGATGTVFDRVRIPAAPDVELAIYVRPAPQGSSIEIRNVTPTKSPDLPDENERWKAAGLKPGGGVLDPTHLQ
jgi:hypothetical protein